MPTDEEIIGRLHRLYDADRWHVVFVDADITIAPGSTIPIGVYPNILVNIDVAAGDVTVSLPATLFENYLGTNFIFRRLTGANDLTIDGNGNTIDGNTQFTLASAFSHAHIIPMQLNGNWMRLDQ